MEEGREGEGGMEGDEGEGRGRGEVEVNCPKIKSHSCFCNFLFFNI